MGLTFLTCNLFDAGEDNDHDRLDAADDDEKANVGRSAALLSGNA